MQERVVVTGLGTINPSGNNKKQFWENFKIGKNSIDQISLFDTTNFKIKIAGECSVDLNDHFNSKERNILDRFSCFAIIAAEEALKDSNLNNNFNSDRAGVILGSGIGGIKSLETQHERLLKSPKKVSPYFIPRMISDIAPGHISIKHGLTPGSFSMCSGCRKPISSKDKKSKKYEEGVSCPNCHDYLKPSQKERFRMRQKQINLAKKLGKKHIFQKEF